MISRLFGPGLSCAWLFCVGVTVACWPRFVSLFLPVLPLCLYVLHLDPVAACASANLGPRFRHRPYRRLWFVFPAWNQVIAVPSSFSDMCPSTKSHALRRLLGTDGRRLLPPRRPRHTTLWVCVLRRHLTRHVQPRITPARPWYPTPGSPHLAGHVSPRVTPDPARVSKWRRRRGGSQHGATRVGGGRGWANTCLGSRSRRREAPVAVRTCR